MSQQVPTIANTPRDAETIAQFGVFAHRKLAEDLNKEGFPLWNVEMEKAAFVTAPPPERAQRLLQALLRYDAAHGGTPPTAQAVPVQQPMAPPPVMQPTAAPMVQQPMMQTPVMQQPVMQQPPPADVLPPREPTNSKKNKAPTNVVAGPAVAAVDLTPVIQRLDALGAMNRTEFEVLKAKHAELEAKFEATQEQLTRLEKVIRGNFGVSRVMLGVLANFGQEVLHAPMDMIIEDSVNVGAEAMQLLAKLEEGKAGQ